MLVLLLATAQAGAAPPQEIVVTGRGLPSPVADAAVPTVVLDRKRITATASGRIEDVLRDVAGLQAFRRSDSRSANPTSQGLTARGLGGNAASRTLLILDGVPQTDPFGGWLSLPAYAPERLARVRAARGAGSGLWGSGALAGTVELESAGPEALEGGFGGLALGSREAVNANGGYAARLGAGHAVISADYARGDGFVPIVQRGSADRPAAYESASGSVRAVTPLSADIEAQTSLLAFTDRRERGLAFTGNRTDGADASLRMVGRGRIGWSLLGYVSTRDFASQFASVNDDRSAATLTLDQVSTPATAIGARAEIAPRFGAAELRAGVDWRRTSGRTLERFSFQAGAATRIREAGGVNETAGLFADLGVEATPALTLSLGGRIDRWSIRDGARGERPIVAGGAPAIEARFADRNGWEPTARAGIAWRAGDVLTLRAAAARGWRLPTLNELYRPFRVGADATAANEALAPERLRSVEAGVDVTRGDARLSVTGFVARLDGAIANVTLASGPGTFPGVGFVSAAGSYRARRNLEAVESRGVEVDGEARVGAARLTLSYAYADPEVRASGAAAALDGLRPAQTPLHQASATVAAGPAAVTARIVSAQFEDDANIRALGEAFTIDAVFRQALTPRLTIEARAENLFDARVEAAVSADGIVERALPRTLWLGLRWGG